MKGRIFLFLFAIPFAGFGSWMLFVIAGELMDASAMRSWQPVQAMLSSAGYETNSGDDSDTWEAYATYRYSYNGQTYTGSRVDIADGADNIGSYQKDLGNRLADALARGETVTVYVDPESPSDSIVDRSPRWGLLAFKSIFVVVFGGVGYGLMAFTIFAKKQKDPESPEFADAPWLANANWQGEPLRSGSKAAMWGAWGFAAFWNAISMPLPFLLVEEITVKENYLALIGLVFPAVGVGLLYWAINRTREWRRFGPTPLSLDPFPGSIGGHVGGSIDLNLPYHGTRTFKVTLTNLLSYVSGSGKNRSRREKANWQDRRIAHAEPGPQGTRIVFRFDVPDELAQSTAVKQSESYTVWRLNLTAELDGADLDRDWEVPVYPTGARSGSIDERKIAEARTLQSADDDKVVRSRIQVRHTAEGKSLYYPMGRHGLSSFMGMLFGGIFGGAGWFLLTSEGAVFMGSIFSLVGWGIAAASVYMLGNSLEVWQDGIKLHSKRRLFGIPIGHKTLHRNAFHRFEKASNMQMQSGGKHTFLFHVDAIGTTAQEIRLGEGFRGDSEANAGIRLIARELGLPLPDEPSANDDDNQYGVEPLEYNALADDN